MALQTGSTRPARYRYREPPRGQHTNANLGDENSGGLISQQRNLEDNSKKASSSPPLSSSFSAAAAIHQQGQGDYSSVNLATGSSSPADLKKRAPAGTNRKPVAIASAEGGASASRSTVTVTATAQHSPHSTVQVHFQESLNSNPQIQAQGQFIDQHPHHLRAQHPLQHPVRPAIAQRDKVIPVYAHWHNHNNHNTLSPTTLATRSPGPNIKQQEGLKQKSSTPAAPRSPITNPHWVPQPQSQLRQHTRSFSANQVQQLLGQRNKVSTAASQSPNSAKGQDQQRAKSLGLANARLWESRSQETSTSTNTINTTINTTTTAAATTIPPSPSPTTTTKKQPANNPATHAAEKRDKGMRRISKFFRSSSATYKPDDKNPKSNSARDLTPKPNQQQPPQLGHKGLSKSTSHLPMMQMHTASHAHPPPSPSPSPVPPPTPQHFLPPPPRRVATSDDLLGAAMRAQPVTRDGVGIPPKLEEVDVSVNDPVSHDRAGDNAEAGRGSGVQVGTQSGLTIMLVGDPGNGDNSGIAIPPTPPPAVGGYDGQRDQDRDRDGPKSAGQVGEQPGLPPQNAPYTNTSRPTTPISDHRPHRKRLSMVLIGGGAARKKSSSRDSTEVITKAWKLSLQSEADSEDYDLTSLIQGAEVPDVWDPQGDTLVYLSAPPLPGQEEEKARFRISSSPLMFAALKGCVVDVGVGMGAGIGSIEEEPAMERLGPDDLFLSIPMSPAEETLGDWGRLEGMIGGEGGKTSEADTESVGGRKSTSSPEPFSPTSGGSQRFTPPPQPSYPPPPPPPQHDTYAVRYKLYYSRFAQEARNDVHGDRKSSTIARLLDARNLFAFLDKKFLVASIERINAFRILEKLYLQLFIEPAISPSSGTASPSGVGSPPGSPRLGPTGRLRRGPGSGSGTPPRTPNSLPGTAGLQSGQSHTQVIDDLPAKILLAEPHLDFYIETLRLDDVRALPPDTESSTVKPRINGFRDSMEAMYLGEKWRNPRLFLEGYLHTVGRWEEIKSSRHPLVDFLTPMTLAKLDRAALDLGNRERELNERFTAVSGAGEFAYPAMFTGVGKYPKFKRWKEGFVDTRELVVRHLKWVYGSWPPRAGRKGKGGGYGGERGGLNREVLKRVERDVGLLWDLVVDWRRPRYPPGGFGDEDNEEEGMGKKKLRKVEGFGRQEDGDSEEEEDEEEKNELRTLLEEFDRASPPVQPRPMFDMPRLPKVPSQKITDKSDKTDKTDKSGNKKLKGDLIPRVLASSWNNLLPTLSPLAVADTSTELLDKFKEMELSFAQNKVLGSTQGRTIADLQDYRRGCWVFIYAVMQSLPMLVVDAPIVRWSEGCEYSLSVGWKHPLLPWEDREVKTSSRGVGGGSGSKRASVMWASAPGAGFSLPTGLGEMGVEGLAMKAGMAAPGDDEVGQAYSRSWCWVRARAWYVKWEEGRREGELRRLLQVSVGERRRERTSDYGSGEGSVVMEERTPTPGTPRRGSPLHSGMLQGGYGGGYQNPSQQYLQHQQYQSYPGFGPGMGQREGRRTSSLGSRSVRSVGSAGSTSSGSGGRGGNTYNNNNTNITGMEMGTGRRTPNASTGINVEDIPEVLLPSTREKRMSSFGPGVGMGYGFGRGGEWGVGKR